jgi:phosphoribosylaminoimidazolecarboxamide formyltransferase/IMP cyclohydrolase
LGLPLSAELLETYAVTPLQAQNMTPLAAAYLRARQCDPLCSFGDFVAVSHIVDEQTALVLKAEVSDGIIAPGFTPAATAILSAKKGGGYIMLAMQEDYQPAAVEWREVYGVALAQKRNTVPVDSCMLTRNVVCGPAPSQAQVLDMLVASITVKYTQSNSIGFAKDGQMVGVGAGQQSRVDCVKLAGRKVATWHMRFHEKVRNLPFRAGVKRQEKVNARVRYIEGDMAPEERAAWLQLFEQEPEELTQLERVAHMKTLTGVALSSDAFFPFRDGIDAAARFGVSSVAQPGGSVGDEGVQAAARDYKMTMVHTGTRLFHH